MTIPRVYDDPEDDEKRDDASAPHRYVCVSCRTVSPEVQTEYTLISARFGWRLTRFARAGKVVYEWRCPPCWAKYKEQRAQQGEPVPSSSQPVPSGPRRRDDR